MEGYRRVRQVKHNLRPGISIKRSEVHRKAVRKTVKQKLDRFVEITSLLQRITRGSKIAFPWRKKK